MQEVTYQNLKDHFKKLLTNCVVKSESNSLELGKGDTIDQTLQESQYKLNMRLQGRNFVYLNKVKTALKRMEEGTFGECQECGARISAKRLLARPTASKCIHCKEEEESFDSKTFHKNRYSLKRSQGLELVM